MPAYTADVTAAIARMTLYNGGFYDQSSNPYGYAGVGYKTNFPQSMNDTALVANAVKAQADAAQTAATAAAAVSASRIKATSTTSLAIGSSGSRTFVTAENLLTAQPVFVGDIVKAVATSSPTNQMVGRVTAVSANSLTIALSSSIGSGTFAAWTLQTQGETGAATGIASVSADTSPNLGGNLNANGFDVSFPTGSGASFAATSDGIAMNGAPLQDARMVAWDEQVQNLGTVSNTVALTTAGGVHKRLVMSGNIAPTLPSSVAANGKSAIVIEVNQPDNTVNTSGAPYTISWPTNVEWAGGVAPSAPDYGKRSEWKLTRRDGETNWYGEPHYINRAS